MSKVSNIQLVKDIIDSLTDELESTDELEVSDTLLSAKVENAYREVRMHRQYPSTYDEEDIESDMERYYANVRAIALYDYNQSGAEYQTSHTENAVSRNWASRESLFRGVIPIAKGV